MQNVLRLSDSGSRTRPGVVLGLSDSLLKGESRSPRTPQPSGDGWAADAQEEISYTIFGDPLPMPRARINRGRACAPPARILEAKERHREATELARPGGWDLEGVFAVYVLAYRGTARACDVDNLSKLVLDAIKGHAFRDDSLVQTLHVEKRIDRDDPRTEVRVVRLGGEQ